MIVNPREPRFWDEQDLTKELHRVYDICHQCRLCFNLCPSFSELFHLIDEKDGDIKTVSRVELNQVTDLCYQCKLCFVKCPYTPPHQWDVDVPRLLLRDKAVRVKKEGPKFEDRILGDPNRTGKKGCSMAPLSNWVRHNSLARKIMAATIGIHEKRNLPDFESTTFEEWFQKRNQALRSDKKVAFFYTCFVNYYAVQQGIAAVKVLEKNGYEVVVPDQVCCGMPFLDGGEVDKATKNMEENVRNFKPVIDSNIPILSVGPTCSYVLKNEFPYFTQHPTAQLMANQTKDLCEFLIGLKSKKELNTDFKNTPSIHIAYQIPCHLRAQNMGYKSIELLRTIPNLDIKLIEQCSAIDGTWGFKKDNFEISLKVAQKLFREVEQSAADEVCTDCPLSAMQIEYGTKMKPMHPVEILHRAYGL